MKLAVPSYWDLSEAGKQLWNRYKTASPALAISVIEASWPAAAANNSTWRDHEARPHLDSLPGIRLGYVGTRTDRPGLHLRDPEEILTGQGASRANYHVKAWYDQFGDRIHGIYFDELFLYQDPDSLQAAVNLVNECKTRHGGEVMALAGQWGEERILFEKRQPPNQRENLLNWVVLWELEMGPYSDQFNVQVLTEDEKINPKPNVGHRATIGKRVPSWWKNPDYRERIVHVVHDCTEPDRQRALGLAKERNAGYIFVMDQRGQGGTYDHLPPYWELEAREVLSYYDFGFDPLRALRAAHRYGMQQPNIVHAWPNFEQVWYGDRHVRGTFFLDPGQAPNHAAEAHEVPLSALPPVHDIAAVWEAVHRYAGTQGWETAMPTFELTQDGQALKIILLRNLPGIQPWLHKVNVVRADTYEQPSPTFAEPGAVIRNVGRAVTSPKYGSHWAAFPTFVPDNPDDPEGVQAHYECYAFDQHGPVRWQDVETATYLNQLSS
jgi:hypothetical protein